MEGPFPERVDAGAVGCRRFRPGDAGALLEVVTDSLEHLLPWMSWVADGYTTEMAEAFVAGAAGDRPDPDPDLAYATLAAAALSEVALGPAGADAVEIHHDQANRRSAAIPERLGYQRVGTAPAPITATGEVSVEWQWRMTAEEWGRAAGARILADARSGTDTREGARRG